MYWPKNHEIFVCAVASHPCYRKPSRSMARKSLFERVAGAIGSKSNSNGIAMN